MIALVEARGVEIPIKHCSNSAGIVEIPEVQYGYGKSRHHTLWSVAVRGGRQE